MFVVLILAWGQAASVRGFVGFVTLSRQVPEQYEL
jgi:hypothetical protein